MCVPMNASWGVCVGQRATFCRSHFCPYTRSVLGIELWSLVLVTSPFSSWGISPELQFIFLYFSSVVDEFSMVLLVLWHDNFVAVCPSFFRTKRGGRRTRYPEHAPGAAPASSGLPHPEAQCCYMRTWIGILLLALPWRLDLHLAPITMTMHTANIGLHTCVHM